jgi:transcriptional regulator with XRE-family HTH domain
VKTIQELREAYGWSHYELAIRVGVRPGTIRDWESGKMSPRTIHLRRLAEVFGVRKDYISTGIETAIDGSRDPG